MEIEIGVYEYEKQHKTTQRGEENDCERIEEK